MCARACEMTVEAYAKINTYLEVMGRREDGYHELCSHMQLITLSDTLTVSVQPADAWSMTLSCDVATVPTGEDNLILRAARALLARYPQPEPLHVHFSLVKRIPMQGGLAGGSTDAAAALLALRSLLQLAVTDDELCDIAATIGADVPFCIRGRRGAQTARGIGERMSDAPGLPQQLSLVLVAPGTAISTPEAFRALDAQMSDPSYNEQSKPDYGAMLTALQAGNMSAIASASFNHFEQIVLPRQPRTAHTFEKMQGCGADMVRMSGSGPTVVGYFTCVDAAARCAALFRADGYDAFAAKLLLPLA